MDDRSDNARAQAGQAMRDWAAIWQSEVSAMATDRELAEAWQRAAACWAGAANAMADVVAQGLPQGERASGRAGTAATTGTAASPVPPDARDVEIERLGRRIADLERRLAALQATEPRHTNR